MSPLGCFDAPSAEANGCSIQSFNFVPRGPPLFVVFLLHHPVGGLGFVVVGSEVSMGPLSADTQPPPPSADSAWFLTHNSGFGFRTTDGRTDGRTTKPPSPQTPFLRTGNRNGTRISISVFFAVSMTGQPPAAVVPGGERQVDRHRHGPSAYGGGRPLPLGRRRFQYIFF